MSTANRPIQLVRRLSTVMLGGVALLIVLTVTAQTRTDSNALTLPQALLGESESQDEHTEVTTRRSSHPSERLHPYVNPAASPNAGAHASTLRAFHDLLEQYVHRQGRDDNFTIRVIDRRTNSVLERYVLDEERSRWSGSETPNWSDVDRHRREAMNRLVDKYETKGVPLEDIIVRWGRADQVEAAHERDRRYEAYERQLAEALGLSLLATEIGTVETFNKDERVSAAGARSRYQMLPWILRQSGVNEYTLPTEGDTWVRVREEHHPLLVLEPAFLLLKGYVNAVGHELPGLSAYHTGPGNIFTLYRQFYSESGRVATASSVADAYVWAVTEGFETIREESTFGGQSRGYVPALYGSLIARPERSDPSSAAFRGVRVQVQPGRSVTLQTLVRPLAHAPALDWGPRNDTASVYERFRRLNPHFDLPPSPDGTVPAAGNLHLIPSIDGQAVRFFLPSRAPSVLRSAGVDALDSTATIHYNESTYSPPSSEQLTRWDRRYKDLVADIEAFGFTEENRQRLLALHERFESLAEERPTRFRKRQLDIIRTHRRLWRSGPWEDLADATEQAFGQHPVRPEPPAPPNIDSLRLPDLDLSSSNGSVGG